MVLTKAQQKQLLVPHKSMIKKHSLNLAMKGHGIMDIVKQVSSFLSPIIQKVGPTVLKEFILPFLKKKMEGQGLIMAGQGLLPSGDGLKLAGQGKFAKGSMEAKAHMAKLRAMRKK